MFWIKDVDGNLINLSLMDGVHVKNGHVEATKVTGYQTEILTALFRGNDIECGKFRDDLFRKLQEVQTNAHIID
jgi:hypothetical protein